MLVLALLSPYVTPLPRTMSCAESYTQIDALKLNCKYSTGSPCPQHIYDNFEFFTRVAYARGTPAKIDASQPSISVVDLVIAQESEAYDVVNRMPEHYEISVENTIQISAESGFAASRAFATMAQLITAHPQHEAVNSAYAVWACKVDDKPEFRWREMMVDSGNRFNPIPHLKRLIDALAVTKQNVLRIRFNDISSYSVKHTKEPQGNLNRSAYDPAYAYDLDDLSDLETYAKMRGVIVYPEIENPMQVTSWGKADPELLCNCEGSTPLLNPIKAKTFDYLKGVLEDHYLDGLFRNFSAHPMLHLGGYVDVACWNKDPEVSAYMKEHGMDANGLLKQYLQNVTDILHNLSFKYQMPYTVYSQDRIENIDEMDSDAIIMYQSSFDVSGAINKEHYVLQATNWRFDEMHPGGYSAYFYMDTWRKFYESNLYSGVPQDKKSQVLGGAAIAYGHAIGAEQMFSTIYPRAIPISEVLWSHPDSRGAPIDRFEQLACRLWAAGVLTGPITIDRPCFGYFYDA